MATLSNHMSHARDQQQQGVDALAHLDFTVVDQYIIPSSRSVDLLYAPPAERAAARLMWLRPGGSIRVLGVQVGDGIDADAEWQTIAGRMLTNMRRWTGTRLTYRARVLILQATVWSLPSFLAMYRAPPDGELLYIY